MKKLTTVLFAASIAVASTAASAWGWGNNGYNDGWGDGYGDGDFYGDFGFSMHMSGHGHGRGYGRGYNGYRGYDGYGYGPYGYVPYGYVPVQPAVELTEEQQKAMAEQQAKHIAEVVTRIGQQRQRIRQHPEHGLDDHEANIQHHAGGKGPIVIGRRVVVMVVDVAVQGCRTYCALNRPW